MYESTPQARIDEESHPGVLADMLNSSSSSDTSSDDSDDDTDASSGSNTTAKRIRRVLRRKRRKSSASSKDTASVPSVVRTPSSHTNVVDEIPTSESPAQKSPGVEHSFEAVVSGDEADTDGEREKRAHGHQDPGFTSRDFGRERQTSGTVSQTSSEKPKKKHGKKHKHFKKSRKIKEHLSEKDDATTTKTEHDTAEPAQSPLRVSFVGDVQEAPENSPKRPFNLRGLSRPALTKVLSSSVFTQPAHSQSMGGSSSQAAAPQANSSVRRTNSLPDRLNRSFVVQQGPSVQPLPHLKPVGTSDSKDSNDAKKKLSRTSAVVLLVFSTGLVAVCADFLVDSIDDLVQSTGVSQAFIGLIILPIVGNAAEHVTAVTVASKNKMDLAIGVALGSSIQIALFVTPVIVLLGWCIHTDMSLYFSLFETVSLFVSAFIVNYLVIDGRSNYLEGALLIAAYVIISVAAFFYPSCENLSAASGPKDSSGSC